MCIRDSKYAERAMTEALRLEEAEHNVRVVEIAPGLVHTPEFSLNRLGGDRAAAEKVYAGVAEPLTGEDVAEVCAFAVELPHHVNIDADPQARGPGGTAQGDPRHLLTGGSAPMRGTCAAVRTAHLRAFERVN